MKAKILIADFARRDIYVQAFNEQLHIDAPKGKLDDADYDTLRKHKTELLAYLTEIDIAPVSSTTDKTDETDPACPCSGHHFWHDSDRWQCSNCHPRPVKFTGPTCTLPHTSSKGSTPYRIVLDGHAQIIWLAAGLSSAEVIAQARKKYSPGRVADPGVAPADGWPSLERDFPTHSTTRHQQFEAAKVGKA